MMSSLRSSQELYPFTTLGSMIRTLESMGPTLSRYRVALDACDAGFVGVVDSGSSVGSCWC